VSVKPGEVQSHDRIQKMSEIRFIWDKFDQAFEKGYKMTLRYMKKNNGDPNAPRSCTVDGFNIGSWQKTVRKKYNKSNLSVDRINRLEEIGFKWELKKKG
jgi:hypothetical protein